jgi:tol-pal system protein YbgF
LKKYWTSALLAAALWASGGPTAFGQKKDTLLIMQQLDALQKSVQDLQRTVDTDRGELRTLIEQALNSVNAMKTTVADLQKATEQSLASGNARSDSLTSQIQALNESLEEAKTRLAKLSDQVAQTQNIIQTLNPPNTGGGATPPPDPSGGGGAAKPTANVPDPDVLYKSGLSSFNGGQYKLAIQAFQEYLQHYGDTDLASNAQFYIGDCYYSQGNYAQAIEEYNKCLERYPNGNKLPAAQLKKGFALLALEQTPAGVRELRSLVQRYPNSREADLARQRLRKLGIALPAHRGA